MCVCVCVYVCVCVCVCVCVLRGKPSPIPKYQQKRCLMRWCVIVQESELLVLCVGNIALGRWGLNSV